MQRCGDGVGIELSLCDGNADWKVKLLCRIIKNVCTMACADPAETPVASRPEPPSDGEDTVGATKACRAATAADAEAAADPVAEAAMVARRVRTARRRLGLLPAMQRLGN